jgi:methylmalonyl-CoA mutase N-terminal domain/subunit
MENEVTEHLQRIENLGGMLSAIENGWVQAQIHESAYKYQQSIESKERIVVGVNEFRSGENQPIPIHLADPALEAEQRESVARVRSRRDKRTIAVVLENLEQVARSTENLMPHILRAVEAYATVGEISDVFRRVHGEYREAWTV